MEAPPIERAHRLGAFSATSPKPRQIIVKFQNFKDRQLVWQAKRNISSEIVRIYEDYPSEIAANRKVLWPIFQAAKQSSDFTNVSLKLDKLWIDGLVYTADKLGNLPRSLKPENRCTNKQMMCLC